MYDDGAPEGDLMVGVSEGVEQALLPLLAVEHFPADLHARLGDTTILLGSSEVPVPSARVRLSARHPPMADLCSAVSKEEWLEWVYINVPVC